MGEKEIGGDGKKTPFPHSHCAKVVFSALPLHELNLRRWGLRGTRDNHSRPMNYHVSDACAHLRTRRLPLLILARLTWYNAA